MTKTKWPDWPDWPDFSPDNPARSEEEFGRIGNGIYIRDIYRPVRPNFPDRKTSSGGQLFRRTDNPTKCERDE